MLRFLSLRRSELVFLNDFDGSVRTLVFIEYGVFSCRIVACVVLISSKLSESISVRLCFPLLATESSYFQYGMFALHCRALRYSANL